MILQNDGILLVFLHITKFNLPIPSNGARILQIRSLFLWQKK